MGRAALAVLDASRSRDSGAYGSGCGLSRLGRNGSSSGLFLLLGVLCSDIFAIFASVSRLDPDGRTVRETNEGTPCESATVTAAVCLGFFSARVAEKKRNVPKRMPLAFGPGRLRSGDESEDRPGTFRLQPAVYGPVIRPELLCGPVFPVAVLYDNVRRL